MEATTVTEALASKKASKGTAYVVLEQMSDDSWRQLLEIKAANSKDAIRKAVNGSAEGTFVAVPKRSWIPLRGKIETKTQLTFS